MPVPGNAEPLEAALDELYGVEPDEFVAARKRLSAVLRAAGERDAAKALQAARRPTTAAWALNQVGRHDPALVEAFLERSRELHAAQVGALTGGRDAMREATRAQRQALAAATEAVMEMLGPRATDAYRTQVLSTLHAAGADEAVGEQLRNGRLVREITGSTGFPEVPRLMLVPDLEQPAEPKPDRPKRATETQPHSAAERTARSERQRSEREREAAEQAERRRAEAQAAWHVAEAEVDVAEKAAAAAHQRVGQLEQDLDRARSEARLADDRVGRSRREVARLARAAKNANP